MDRYITEFRWLTGNRYSQPLVHDWHTPERTLPTDLRGVFELITEYHDAETKGHNCQPADGQGVFRCTRFNVSENTARDVTEDVLEAYRMHRLAETGEEPWWLHTDAGRAEWEGEAA